MLHLKNIYKYYKYGKNKKVILDKINLSFENNGMVFILGASGSGKTTLLNIIAGYLNSDEGEVYVGNRDIKDFSLKEVNYYCSSVIGYIYQDYNLIDYMSVIDNVKIGCNKDIEIDKINLLLKQLGIYEKRNTRIVLLSGGEKQRVAIARALINDPKIILADEPTGALDSDNGVRIMEILKRVSKNKLVIIVSHDLQLALSYGDRIIRIKDGKIVSDVVNSYGSELGEIVIKKSKFLRGNLWKLAFLHLWIKKGRSIMTMVSMSLGIFSMMLVLFLSNCFNRELDLLEKDLVNVFPVTIKNQEYLMDEVALVDNTDGLIYKENNTVHVNKINDKYLDYINSLDMVDDVVYRYDKFVPVISDCYHMIDTKYLEGIPSNKYIEDNYEILSGRMVNDKNEILIKVDKNNMINNDLVSYFDFNDTIRYDEIIGRKIKIITNDLYYVRNGNYYYARNDYQELYNNGYIELTIVGIIREKEDNLLDSFIYFDDEIMADVIKENKDSEIIKLQSEVMYNVLGINISKEEMLSYLGGDEVPCQIDIYVDNLDDKKELLDNLDMYNDNNERMIYEDVMADNIKIVKDFINVISVILLIFSIVALIISLLMIGILTSIRILEKKKEIGIVRSLGASKRDIRKIFNIENMIISCFSSLIGVMLVLIFRIPIKKIFNDIIMLDISLEINTWIMILVMAFIMIIVRIAGSIPIRKANRLEIVNCIYDR